jgi:hypothetical protein
MEVWTMASYSEYFGTVGRSSINAFSRMLNDPALWSETMIRRTMRQSSGSVYNILEVQLIIRDYLGILSEAVRKGERLPVGLLSPSPKSEQKLLKAG